MPAGFHTFLPSSAKIKDGLVYPKLTDHFINITEDKLVPISLEPSKVSDTKWFAVLCKELLALAVLLSDRGARLSWRV